MQSLEPRLALASVDLVAPVVRSVAAPKAQAYPAGSLLLFKVTFSEKVLVVGTPTLPITIGNDVRQATWNGVGSGGRSLVFTTTVQSGDRAPNGVAIGGPINLVGGAVIRDLAGNPLIPAASGSFPRVIVDAVGPSMSGFGGVTVAPRLWSLPVRFDEPVTVKGKPSVPFTVGGAQRQLVYNSGSGKNVLIFKYRPAAGDLAPAAGVDVTARAIGLNGGSIVDKAGNAAASLAAPTDILISNAIVSPETMFGAVVGTLSTSDADAARDTFRYMFVPGDGAADNGSFTIDGNHLKSLTTFNADAKSTYSIRVRATDRGGLAIEKQISIVVVRPFEISISNATIAERGVSGVVVGTLATTDPAGGGGEFTYAFVSGDGATDNQSFTINGDRLTSAVVFDADLKSSYSVRVRATRSDGRAAEKQLTVTIIKLTSLKLDPSAGDRGVLRGTWSDGTAVTYFGSVDASGRVSSINTVVIQAPAGGGKTLHFSDAGRLEAIEAANGDSLGLTWDSNTAITVRLRRAGSDSDLIAPIELGASSQARMPLSAMTISQERIAPASAVVASVSSTDCLEIAKVIGDSCAFAKPLFMPGVAEQIAFQVGLRFGPQAAAATLAVLKGSGLFCSTVGYSPESTPEADPLARSICEWIDRFDPPPPPPPTPPPPAQELLVAAPTEITADVGLGLTDGQATFTVTNNSNFPIDATVTAAAGSVIVEVGFFKTTSASIKPGESIAVTVRAPWDRFTKEGVETIPITVHGVVQGIFDSTGVNPVTEIRVQARIDVKVPKLEVEPSTIARTVPKGPEALFDVRVTNVGSPITQLDYAFADFGSEAMFVRGSEKTFKLRGGESETLQIRVPTDSQSWFLGETREFVPSVRMLRPIVEPDPGSKIIAMRITLDDIDLRGVYSSRYSETVVRTTRTDSTNNQSVWEIEDIEDIQASGFLTIVVSECKKSTSEFGFVSWKISGSVTLTNVDGTDTGRDIRDLPFTDVDFFPQDAKFNQTMVQRPEFANPELEEWIRLSDFVFELNEGAWVMKGSSPLFFKQWNPDANTNVRVQSGKGPASNLILLRIG